MKVFLIFIICSSFYELSAVNNQYRGNPQNDYNRLIEVLDDVFSAAATLMNKLIDVSARQHKHQEINFGQLAQSFQAANFENGKMISMLMQKNHYNNFVALSRMYLPVPLPEVQFNNADNYFNNSIRQNQNLNFNLMKMWSVLKESGSRADQFLKNILSAFDETMRARPDLISTISKLSGLPIPCYRAAQANRFLGRDVFFAEALKEVDLYIELLKILDLKNERQYEPQKLECLKMFAKKFVLSGSKVVSALTELFRHSREFERPENPNSLEYVELQEQLIVEHPISFNTLSMMFNDAMYKNGAVLNLCMFKCDNHIPEIDVRLQQFNNFNKRSANFDIDSTFRNAIDANQKWNYMLMFQWKKFTNPSNIPADLLNSQNFRRIPKSASNNAVSELREISQILNVLVAHKVDLITVLLGIWAKGRTKLTTTAELNSENYHLNEALNMPSVFDQTLKLPTLQNSPSFLNSVGSSNVDGLLSGFMADPSAILGLDIGGLDSVFGGLGVGSLLGGGLDSLLGDGLQAIVTPDKVNNFGEGLIDQRFLGNISQNFAGNSNSIKAPSVPNRIPVPTRTQTKTKTYADGPIIFPKDSAERSESSMKINMNGKVTLNTSIKSHNSNPLSEARSQKQPYSGAIIFPDNPRLQRNIKGF